VKNTEHITAPLQSEM